MSKEELEKEVTSLRQELTRKSYRISSLYYVLSNVCDYVDGLIIDGNMNSWQSIQERLEDMWSDNIRLVRVSNNSNNNSNNNNNNNNSDVEKKEEVNQILDQMKEEASSKEYFHGENFICSICYSPYIAPPHVSSPLVLGCGHMCCVKCCKTIYEGPKKTCPFCNKKIEKIIPLYN